MGERIITCPIEFDESLIRKKVEFIVPGKPFAKQRPRVVTRGGFARAYTPKQTVDYEKLVKDSYKQVNGNCILDKPLEAKIIGVFPVPISESKKRKTLMLDGKIQHTKKPDCDNMGKIILDALNKVAYNDDSQICDLYVKKIYGENPMVKISLKEI